VGLFGAAFAESLWLFEGSVVSHVGSFGAAFAESLWLFSAYSLSSTFADNWSSVICAAVVPLSEDSRRPSCDSSSGSRGVKVDPGNQRSPTVAVHPSMEGLVSFVPPELTERTLMPVSVLTLLVEGMLQVSE